MACKVCYRPACRYAGDKPMTVNGAPASPRLAAVYRYLHAEGVPLSDWSTDECVKHAYGKLKAAVEALPEGQLRSDVERLLARVPEARA